MNYPLVVHQGIQVQSKILVARKQAFLQVRIVDSDSENSLHIVFKKLLTVLKDVRKDPQKPDKSNQSHFAIRLYTVVKNTFPFNFPDALGCNDLKSLIARSRRLRTACLVVAAYVFGC